jgi:hypothetical protein
MKLDQNDILALNNRIERVNFLVYVAAPFSEGDNATNIRLSMCYSQRLFDSGLVPFNPLLLNQHFIVHPADWTKAIQWCLSYLTKCDALVRIPGVSSGADIEVAMAEKIGIPVFETNEDELDNGRPGYISSSMSTGDAWWSRSMEYLDLLNRKWMEWYIAELERMA